MNAGRELDALVAEKVMGVHLVACAICGDSHLPLDVENDCHWSPSTSVEAASQVEEKIGEGYNPDQWSDYPPNNRVYRYLEELHRLVGHPIGYDSSFDDDWALLRATPHQRCLAALKAMGVAVPE